MAEGGSARFYKGADATLDRYLGRSGCRTAFRHYARVRLFSPAGDRCVRSGFRRAQVYVNAQAIAVADARRNRNLDRLVLRDAGGRRLYVPFGCQKGRCPQYAADISSPAWRRYVARQVRGAMRAPYVGVFLDDVNFERNVSDGRAEPVAPRSGGSELTTDEWKRSMAAVVRSVRRAAPKRELALNTVWWKPESSLDDPDVASAFRAATDLEIERGTDDIRKGQSFDALLAVIDRVHDLGAGVTLENYEATDRAGAEFEMATHLLTSEGRDTFAAEWRSCPRATKGYKPCAKGLWPGYRTRLGPPLGPRERRPDGLWQRRFRDGLVLVNPPGAATGGGSLDGLYRDLDGRPYVFAVLEPGRGLVLKR